VENENFYAKSILKIIFFFFIYNLKLFPINLKEVNVLQEYITSNTYRIRLYNQMAAYELTASYVPNVYKKKCGKKELQKLILKYTNIIKSKKNVVLSSIQTIYVCIIQLLI